MCIIWWWYCECSNEQQNTLYLYTAHTLLTQNRHCCSACFFFHNFLLLFIALRIWGGTNTGAHEHETYCLYIFYIISSLILFMSIIILCVFVCVSHISLCNPILSWSGSNVIGGGGGGGSDAVTRHTDAPKEYWNSKKGFVWLLRTQHILSSFGDVFSFYIFYASARINMAYHFFLFFISN